MAGLPLNSKFVIVPGIRVNPPTVSVPTLEPGEMMPPEAGATGTRLAWLDVLRGLAALAVVFDHVSYYALQHVRHV